MEEPNRTSNLISQPGDGAAWAVGPPAPAWLSDEAAPQLTAGCSCVRLQGRDARVGPS